MLHNSQKDVACHHSGLSQSHQAPHKLMRALQKDVALTHECVCFRDIFTVRLTPGKQVPDAQKSSETGVPYVCPVTGLTCLRYPFTALPDCGHAFSSRAVAQVCLYCACLPALPGEWISVFQQTAGMQHVQSFATSAKSYVLAALSL